MESTLHNNDEIREEERVCMDSTREEIRVRMEQNDIIISSELLSSDDSLETSSDDSSDSVRRQIPTKPLMSSQIKEGGDKKFIVLDDK